MQTHLDKECLGAPDNAKSKQNVNSQGFNSNAQNNTPNIIPNTAPNIIPNTIPNALTNRPVKRTKKTKTSNIGNFVDRMGEEEQEDLEF